MTPVVRIQRDCAANISPQRYKVKSLLKLLYDNTVSPIHMIEQHQASILMNILVISMKC